jgi:CRISPR-associated endonuclease Csn1
MVKKEKYKDVKIRPWNFDEVVDTSKTASDFIKRMLNYCTYCYGEEVLPKEDLIYQEYCCLNQLNKLKFFNSENSKEEYIDSSIKQTL